MFVVVVTFPQSFRLCDFKIYTKMSFKDPGCTQSLILHLSSCANVPGISVNTHHVSRTVLELIFPLFSAIEVTHPSRPG